MGAREKEQASLEARAVTLESGEVSSLQMDLTVLGGKDRATGLFAHVTMRSAVNKRPLGYVRATLVGVDANSSRAQQTAFEIATRVWRLQKNEGAESLYFMPSAIAAEASPTLAGETPIAKAASVTDLEPVVSDPARTIWLIGTEDLRQRNQGVRVTLNLRTDDPHAGYLFAHVLSASPEAAVDAASAAARGVWLPLPAEPIPSPAALPCD